MKWLTQLRASFSLDEKRRSPDADQIARARGMNFGDSAKEIASVDNRLSAEKPECALPPSLHTSIMSAVRRSISSSDAASKPSPAWWPAPALASVLVACSLAGIYFLAPRPAPRMPIGNVQQQIAALPGTVISPLSNEMELLERDLEKTTSFLLASIPQIDN